MAQISSFGALPDPNVHLSSGAGKTSSSSSTLKSSTTQSSSSATTDQAETSPIQAQLTRLSSVLSSLQKNANSTRTQYVQALNKVKSGTYSVSSLDVSRSIVSDLLTDG